MSSKAIHHLSPTTKVQKVYVKKDDTTFQKANNCTEEYRSNCKLRKSYGRPTLAEMTADIL